MRKSEKQRLKLERRKKDYEAMISKSRTEGWSAYKKPGSNKKG